jgi:hypothetical protein
MDYRVIYAVEGALDGLMERVWEEVKKGDIGKLAPKTTHGEYSHTVQSFVYQSFAEKYKERKFGDVEKDPHPLQKDNMGAGSLPA